MVEKLAASIGSPPDLSSERFGYCATLVVTIVLAGNLPVFPTLAMWIRSPSISFMVSLYQRT